ncbi:unnamed protein product [Effrenium voratum]|nr:unnamed protein product [Effrenium voratum]
MSSSYLPTLLSRRRQKAEPASDSKANAASAESKSETKPKEDAIQQVEEETNKSSLRSNLMGSAMKSLLQRFDSSVLGAEVELGELSMNAFTGKIELSGLTIHNPEGFNSEYLMKAGEVIIDLDLQELIMSRGKKIEIQEVMFKDVDVIYEKSLTTSNVDTVLLKLNGEHAQDAQPDKDASVPDLVLHKVVISDIGAQVVTSLLNVGPRVAVGDLCYEDFQAEVGTDGQLMVAVQVVLDTLLKSIVATVIGKEHTKSVYGLLEKGRQSVRSAFASLGQHISELYESSSSCCGPTSNHLMDEEVMGNARTA